MQLSALLAKLSRDGTVRRSLVKPLALIVHEHGLGGGLVLVGVFGRGESHWVCWRLLSLEARMELWQQNEEQVGRRRVGIPMR